MDISKVYRAEGDVIGYLWGGGVASYPTGLPSFLRANSLEELRAAIQAAIDAEHRFGDFEALIGAVMDITTVEIITIDGKRYFREESEIEIFFHSRIAPCDHEKWSETFRQMLETV